MSDLILKEAIDNLSNDDVSVRKEAINDLIGVTDIEAIDPLIEATTDDNAQIRFKAAEILGNMGEVARDKLIEKFEASEGKNKRFLTFALKETKDEKVIPYFASAVEDDDFGVRKTAIRALGELQAHDELYTIAKGLEDEDWGVRLATIYALGDLASDESIDLIKDARRNEKDKDFKKSCNKALKKAEKAKKAKASGETLSKVKPISTIKEMEKTNVQKAIKEYVSNLKNTYIEIEELYSGINPNSIFSAQNINHKDLSEIDEIIKEYKDKSQNCVDELEKLVAEESISENINNKSFSTREKYYKNLYNTVMLSDAMKSQYSSLKEKVKDEKSKLNEKVSKIEKIKNFLENNKDAWEIKDDKIQFNNLNRMTEYYGLLNQLVD